MNMHVTEKSLRIRAGDAIRTDIEASDKRVTPLKVNDAKYKGPVALLEAQIIKWAPRDIRYDHSYTKNHFSCDYRDSEYMEDIFRGLSLKVIERSPITNTVKVGVLFQSNFAEFDEYNAMIEKHNEEWEAAGCPNDVLDPVTGDIYELEDTHVEEAVVKSPFSTPMKLPKNKGKLTKMSPKAQRTLYLICEYRLDIVGKDFILGYVCYTTTNHLLCYNQITSDNLAYAVRRATQEIYGHPFINGDSGPFLDGISILIQGRKIAVCKERGNLLPDWAEGRFDYTSNEKLNAYEHNESLIGIYHFLSGLFGYALSAVIPLYCLVISTYNILGQSYRYTEYQEGSPVSLPIWVVTVVAGVALTYICLQIGSSMREKEEQLKIKNKFS